MQLYLALDGEQGAAAPYEWIIGIVCEEFHLSPSQALWEIENAPVGLIRDILELRGFARTKQALEAAKGTKREAELYETPSGALVLAVELLAVEWRQEQRRQALADETLGE